jgi:hypothetical protein
LDPRPLKADSYGGTPEEQWLLWESFRSTVQRCDTTGEWRNAYEGGNDFKRLATYHTIRNLAFVVWTDSSWWCRANNIPEAADPLPDPLLGRRLLHLTFAFEPSTRTPEDHASAARSALDLEVIRTSRRVVGELLT